MNATLSLFPGLALIHGCCCCPGWGPPQPESEAQEKQSPSSEQATPADAAAPQDLKYEVLRREVDDSRIKTQVELRILVDETATGDRLQRTLETAVASVGAETGFRNREHPNSIWIYAYDHRNWSDDPIGWIGMAQKAAVDPKPTYTLAPGRGDIERVAFATRVAEACPGLSGECSADGERLTISIAHTVDTDEDKVSVWFSVFYALQSLSSGVPDAKAIRLIWTRAGIVVVEVELSRDQIRELDLPALDAALGAAEAVVGEQYDVGTVGIEEYDRRLEKAHLAVYRKWLKRMPAAKVARDLTP